MCVHVCALEGVTERERTGEKKVLTGGKKREEEKAGELSVMLSVSRAGCDKRDRLAAVGIYLPSLSVCLSLSLPLFQSPSQNTNTHIKREKDPVVFLSATHERTQCRCAAAHGSHLSTAFWGGGMTGGIQMVRPEEQYVKKGEFTFCSCRLSV